MIDIILRWLLCLSPAILSAGVFNAIGMKPGQQLATSLIFCGVVAFLGSAVQSYVKVIIEGES